MPGTWDFVTGDALVANSFGCEIDGQAIVVKEVSGLKQEFDMIEVKSQTSKGLYQLKKIPGRPKPVTVTITRSLTDDDFFEKWMKLIEHGATARRVALDHLARGRYSCLESTLVICGVTRERDFDDDPAAAERAHPIDVRAIAANHAALLELAHALPRR